MFLSLGKIEGYLGCFGFGEVRTAWYTYSKDCCEDPREGSNNL